MIQIDICLCHIHIFHQDSTYSWVPESPVFPYFTNIFSEHKAIQQPYYSLAKNFKGRMFFRCLDASSQPLIISYEENGLQIHT